MFQCQNAPDCKGHSRKHVGAGTAADEQERPHFTHGLLCSERLKTFSQHGKITAPGRSQKICCTYNACTPDGLFGDLQRELGQYRKLESPGFEGVIQRKERAGEKVVKGRGQPSAKADQTRERLRQSRGVVFRYGAAKQQHVTKACSGKIVCQLVPLHLSSRWDTVRQQTCSLTLHENGKGNAVQFVQALL